MILVIVFVMVLVAGYIFHVGLRTATKQHISLLELFTNVPKAGKFSK